jgi:NAD(P)-dependent dehydrogenase (short-subunit alcohol dehydrogenase family)
MTPQNLTGKVALVTGGSRGIGMAIAESMVAEGMQVAITGRDDAHLLAAKHRINGSGPGRLETIVADVRNHEDVERAIDTVVLAYGGGIFTQVADMTPDQWSAIIDTNLTGVYNCCHLAIPQLRKRGGGYIINISSLAGKNAFVGAAAYCASKAGLNAFSEALMLEVRQENIRVTYVMPGSVATGFSGGDEHKGAEWKIGASDIAQIVLDLLHMNPRTLPSRVEVRPSRPPVK